MVGDWEPSWGPEAFVRQGSVGSVGEGAGRQGGAKAVFKRELLLYEVSQSSASDVEGVKA